MRDRFWRTGPAALTLAFAACGGSTSGGTGGGGASPSIAQSAVVREPLASVSQAAIAGAVAANNDFAIDLFTHVRADVPADNLLTSPMSASLALTMTYAGAAGTTATQMATALHFGAAAGSITDGQNALSQLFAKRGPDALEAAAQTASDNGGPAPSPDDYQLQVVNSVWGQNAYPWEQPFLDVLARSYGAGVFLEDFAAQPDPARLAINSWVSARTADKIMNLLPEGSIDGDTRMVLVNAIHLKMPWTMPFDAGATMPGTFTTASGAAVSASFMNNTTDLGYVDDGQAQIVSIPLAGGDLRVVIALPHGDLGAYEDGLTSSSRAFQPLGSAMVALSLPKVAFTSPTFSLAKSLKAMGMTDAFDMTNASFTKMCAHPPDGNLYIEDVLQKAMLAMQENGVEAAAATAVIVDRSLSGESGTPVSMVVNQPFLVAIIDSTGAILFLGHIDDPTQTGSP
ncbi:MAG TPA: serpin family protein [Polyangiaceae bacterium]|nr:serpin family protein [Polyangiaceae bacterium]